MSGCYDLCTRQNLDEKSHSGRPAWEEPAKEGTAALLMAVIKVWVLEAHSGPWELGLRSALNS